MLHQLHWQFKDGSTEMRAQRDIGSHDELRAFAKEVRKEHPLPDGAIWMFCIEESNHFVLTKKDNE